jgi:GH15 family glucan-1,4-alpha-glucosidase
VSSNSASACRIQDYAVIGDCRSSILISKYGSIDWLAWPRFDSSPLFASLLDTRVGGHWKIAPVHTCESRRRYWPGTAVLETEWSCGSGRASVLDVVPVESESAKRKKLFPDHELIRELRCHEGEMVFEVDFYPRGDYGRKDLGIRDRGALGLRMDDAGGSYWLRSDAKLEIRNGRVVGRVKVMQGERVQFSLTYTEEAPAVLPVLGDMLSARIDETRRWWESWSGRCSYQGPYRDAVLRSALTLKLLTYAPSGAVVAASTTSLPEILGGSFNWDYRYCWLRDASLTVRALLGLGYREEAESFLTWLLHATRMTQPELRIMYDVFGKIAPRERTLDHLSGFCDSRPVRVGNGARTQLQLDIYGEVIDAAAQFARVAGPFDRSAESVLIGFGKYVSKNWDQADEGIWEPRTGRRNNTHSRLMCWTALDRLLEMQRKELLRRVPVEEFTRVRDQIRSQIHERAWNSALQSYASTLDGDGMDATLLRIPWYGLEPADSERMKLTYQQVRKQLGAGDSLLYRYTSDPREGAFGICGFWAAEYLAIGGGTIDEAHRCFSNLLEYQNDLGLYSEEIDPRDGGALGNFPQAFTHVGLISTALSIQEHERGEPHPAEQRHAGPSIAQQEAAQ